ncbi:uroporphyrinogen-III synthase [Shimia sp. SDUM112013]|uniref:uroporphyrinogen-III synthase n=1 Tax=Shimia sp. SDUM112013 TaxID=3136160 RepID=UPI0032EB3BAF
MTAQLPTIVLTRPHDASERFAKLLKEAGLSNPVVISPVVEIIKVPHSVPEQFSGAIFTSVNGVGAVPGRDLPAWCVGERTAEVARAKGWRAVSADGDVDDLFALVMQSAPKGSVVHFRGLHAKGDLARRLVARGIKSTDIVVYRQDAVPLTDQVKTLLMGNDPIILPLFSPRSAATLCEQGPFRAPMHVVAISAATADSARGLASRGVLISRAPNANAMVAAINHVVNGISFVEDDQNTA